MFYKKSSEPSKDSIELCHFLNEKLIAEYHEMDSKKTADFYNEFGLCMNNITKMSVNDLRDIRFYNIEDSHKLTESEIRFEALI